MFESSSSPLMYLRFGIQRKKKFLQDVGAAFDGLVLPANVLLYQYRSTPTVVFMCRKPYFVDPMSYLFGQPYEVFKTRLKKGPSFKPSFDRLMRGHGLRPEEFLPLPYKSVLRALHGNPKTLRRFVDEALRFQTDRVRITLTEASELMSEEQRSQLDTSALSPVIVLPPYLLYSTKGREGQRVFSLNESILAHCAGRKTETPSIFPVLCIHVDELCSPTLAAALEAVTRHGFSGYCLWVAGFEERYASEEQATALIRAVRTLAQGRAQVVMLFGGFFSLLLHKFGLTCVSHGLAYSESRALGASASQTSGPAPVRYYLIELHRFLTLEDALVVLRRREDLVCSCPVCRRVMQGDPERVILFREQEELAEMHFLYMRHQERRMIEQSSLEELVAHLRWTVQLNDDLEDIKRTFRRGEAELERSVVRLDYLQSWIAAITATDHSIGAGT